MNTDELRNLLAITLVPGVGNFTIKQLLSYFGSAQQIATKTKGELLKVPTIGEKTALKILEFKAHLEQADAILEKCSSSKAQIISYIDPEYPKNLTRYDDAPSHLYVRGTQNLNTKRKVSIVGTRNASPYGKEVTEEIVAELKEYNPIIVSGMAYGIDILAHRAALQHKLETIGVVASGPDVIYPPEHLSTAKEMVNTGAILSELPPGIKPEPHFFPARNRIIAGLADVVIVVEAAEKGGALITAEIASSYNIEVYAVPGNINHKYSRGCNKIIQNHIAKIFTSTEELVEYLGWKDEDSGKPRLKKVIDLSGLNEQELLTYNCLLDKESCTIDNLSRELRIELNKLAGILLSLEFQDLIEPLPGKKFKVK